MAENATHNLHNLADAAGRGGPRRPHLVALPQRGHRPVRRRHRRGLRLAPLADVGTRPRRHLPLPAARPLRLPARPDAAADEPGLHRHRDRRDDGDAARAGGVVAHPRLLRLGQPQREGDLPALPRLVRRQPGQPVAAPAGEPRPRATSSAWAAPTPSSRKAQGYIDDGDLRFAAELLNHVVFADDRPRRRPRAARRRLRHTSATAPRTARGATSTCRAPTSCATAIAGRRARARRRARHGRRRSASTSSSTRSPSGSTGPSAWDEHLDHRLGASPTSATPTAPS